MAYSGANLDGESIARHNADLPIIVHSNVARDCLRAFWNSTGSVVSATNMQHPIWRSIYAYDDKHHIWTRPRVGAAVMYLCFEFASPGVAFDVAGILGGNFTDVGGTVTVSIQIANSADFSTDLLTVAAWSSDLGRRLIQTEVGAGNPGITVGRYSGVQYLRVRIASNGIAPLPRIGEVWLGTRSALRGRPAAADYDESELEGGVSRWVSESGRIVMVHRYDGRRVLRASWDGLDDDEADRFRAAWNGSDSGRDSMLWIEHPDTAPRVANVMRSDVAEFAAPEPSGESNRIVDLMMLEDPPYAHNEAA